MKIKIDEELADKIVLKSLKRQRKFCKESVSMLESSGKLQQYQEVDLECSRETLTHLKYVIQYFGG